MSEAFRQLAESCRLLSNDRGAGGRQAELWVGNEQYG